MNAVAVKGIKKTQIAKRFEKSLFFIIDKIVNNTAKIPVAGKIIKIVILQTI
jgi:hypothetical protein